MLDVWKPGVSKSVVESRLVRCPGRVDGTAEDHPVEGRLPACVATGATDDARGSRLATRRGLLDNLIRSQQERGRDGQAKSLCSLEINRKVKLSRLLDGQIGRLGPIQNPVDVRSSDTPSLLE